MLQKFLTTFMSQQWEDLLFLHWATESAPLATKLPAELEIDLYQGQAWLSVVGFRLTNLRIKPFTKIPWKDFCEVNLRTYVKDSAGRCGVWFFSLDSSDLLAVTAARALYGLNYRVASMHSDISVNRVQYCSKTKLPFPRVEAEMSTACEQVGGISKVPKRGSLDYFLLERYRFWSARKFRGDLTTAQVNHPPYNFVRLSDAKYKGKLFKCQNLEEPITAPELIHYSKGFPVTASAPSWAFGIAGQANHK